MKDKKEEQKQASSRASKIKEIIKDGSGLGLLKVLGTALTAVSMTILSAQIAGLVNSLMLVAILSIGTAVVNEFYRIVLSFTSLGAKRIVAPVFKTVEDTKTGEIITIEEESPIVAVDVSEIEEKENESQLSLYGRVKGKVFRYFKNNTIMRFVLLFLIVSLITIGINYFTEPEEEPIVYTYTTNHTTEQQIIEEPTTQPVIEERTVVVKEEKTEVDNELEGQEGNEPTPQPVNLPEPSPNSNNEDIEDLRSRVETLEEENTTLRTEVEELRTTNPDTVDEDGSVSAEEMNEQIRELQRQIDELRDNNVSDSSSSQESSINNGDTGSVN